MTGSNVMWSVSAGRSRRVLPAGALRPSDLPAARRPTLCASNLPVKFPANIPASISGLRVVCGAVAPGGAWLQPLGRHVRHCGRHVDVEDRIGDVRHVVERARESRRDHRARMRDLHPAADTVRTARPACIDQPDACAARRDSLTQQLRVRGRVMHHERRAEAGAERRLRFGDSLLRACHLGGVAGEKVVHRAGRRQPRDRRQHAECIACQHHDIRRMVRRGPIRPSCR